MSNKNDNTLVKNASFLMVAALISKIIGMLYKSPLNSTLGNQSFALFQFAQNAYFILLMIASSEGFLLFSALCGSGRRRSGVFLSVWNLDSGSG